jgi:hypothetical protein
VWDDRTEDQERDMSIRGIEAFDAASDPLVNHVTRLTKRVARLNRLARLTQDLNLFDASRLLRDVQGALGDLSSDVAALAGVMERTVVAPTAADETAWAEAFEQALKDLKVPLEPGTAYPSYKVFPFEIKVDLAAETVWLNNRVTHVLRPRSLAKLVQNERERLYGERFNAGQFMKALATVYDLLKGDDGKTFSVPLRRAHEILSLRSGSAGYSLRQFAFDLYRLRYQSDMVYEGRQFVLNPSRSPRGAVQVPHPNGGMENLGSYEMIEVSP